MKHCERLFNRGSQDNITLLHCPAPPSLANNGIACVVMRCTQGWLVTGLLGSFVRPLVG